MKKKRYKDIFEAIDADDIEAVKLFLPEHANDINNYYGFTALVYTIHFAKNKQIFDLLLDNGADPYTGSNIHSVLYWLWFYNWPDKLQKLVDSGYDLNSDKSLVISDVCRSLGRAYVNNIYFDLYLAFLKELIRCGARTDIPDEKGKLPLDNLSDEIRTEVETYIANLETEKLGNIAHETGFAYDV